MLILQKCDFVFKSLQSKRVIIPFAAHGLCAHKSIMKHDPIGSGTRKPVNVSLDTGIVAAARDVGINLSRTTELALRAAIKSEQERRWREDNAVAIGRFTEWYETNGDPLAHLAAL